MESHLHACQSLPEDADVPGRWEEAGMRGGEVGRGEGACNQYLETLFHFLLRPF